MERSDAPLSIRRSLQVSVTLSVAAVFAAGALGVYIFVRTDANSRFLSRLEERLERCVDETEMAVAGEIDSSFHEATVAWFEMSGGINPDSSEVWKRGREGENFYDIHEPYDADVGFLWYVLRDHRGETLLKCPWLKDTGVLPHVKSSTTSSIVFGISESPGGRPLRTASISFQIPLETLDPEEIGLIDTSATEAYDPAAPENRAHLTIAQSDEGIRKMLFGLGLALTGMGVLITVVTSALIFYLIKRSCRPLMSISETVALIEPGQRDARLSEAGVPSELTPLVGQFNALLDRVAFAFERERRFSADIAHELRTPVAELRTLAEVALAPSDHGDEKENPEEIYRETVAIAGRMGRLIDVLSELHRAEKWRDDGGVREPVVLTTLLKKTIAALAGEAGRRDLSIDVSSASEIPAPVTDPALLRGILDNVLGNAVTYAEPKSTVFCLLDKAEGGGISLEVRNVAADLTADDLSHLEEPFWRKDSARSDADHFGLGLSTVAAYARVLGATVGYRLGDGEFIVELKIPRTP